MLIDTHCHLDDPRYGEDLEAVLARAKEAGVGAVIIPGADPDTLPRAVELAEKYEGIYFAVGVHPYDMQKYEERAFHELLPHPRCVAVGECGLDYYRLPEDKEAAQEEIVRQKEVFARQIRLALRYAKPLIVHIRDASADAARILEEEGAGGVGGVLHCFNADRILLPLAGKGFYFGIGGVLTFKNAKKLPWVLPEIPEDRLLIETDGPYLTPHPHRGKRNEPAYTALVAQKMGEILGHTPERIAELTTANALRLFGDLV